MSTPVSHADLARVALHEAFLNTGHSVAVAEGVLMLLTDARVAVLQAELARIRHTVDALVDAGWMSLEAATELRNVYDSDEEGQR